MPTIVAVVEDNPDNRMLMEALLEDRFDLQMLESGRAALEAWSTRMPAVVLLDISLPDMDGTEVLATMRAHDALRSIPVIALTAHAMAGDRERFLALGFDDYVSKPILDENTLFAAIERALLRGPLRVGQA